jgi:hypothetical protein
MDFANITPEVTAAVRTSRARDALALVNAISR